MVKPPYIEASGISKKFSKSLKRSMIYGLADIGRNLIRLNSRPGSLRRREFWALRDVDFALEKGKALGVIGSNGSGKTTLLKLLNGIFWPDTGEIKVRGRTGALIEVGAGFHPTLTGRENIYINGAILGLNRGEISAKFDDIVTFAGLQEFLDMPVKNYSSGMLVRLGFAISVHCAPDVLLIDEILAVGDMNFRRRCYNKIDELKQTCAILFVSHNMHQIGRICDDVLVLNRGSVHFLGPATQGIAAYYNIMSRQEPDHPVDREDEGPIRISKAFHRLEGNRLEITFQIEKDKNFIDKNFSLSITFTDMSDAIFAHVNSLAKSEVFCREKKITCVLPQLNFNHGRYRVNAVVYDDRHSRYYSMYRNILTFDVEKEFVAGANIHFDDACWDKSDDNG